MIFIFTYAGKFKEQYKPSESMSFLKEEWKNSTDMSFLPSAYNPIKLNAVQLKLSSFSIQR